MTESSPFGKLTVVTNYFVRADGENSDDPAVARLSQYRWASGITWTGRSTTTRVFLEDNAVPTDAVDNRSPDLGQFLGRAGIHGVLVSAVSSDAKFGSPRDWAIDEHRYRSNIRGFRELDHSDVVRCTIPGIVSELEQRMWYERSDPVRASPNYYPVVLDC